MIICMLFQSAKLYQMSSRSKIAFKALVELLAQMQASFFH